MFDFEGRRIQRAEECARGQQQAARLEESLKAQGRQLANDLNAYIAAKTPNTGFSVRPDQVKVIVSKGTTGLEITVKEYDRYAVTKGRSTGPDALLESVHSSNLDREQMIDKVLDFLGVT